MSYTYKIETGNPEGVECIYRFKCDAQMDSDEFSSFVEEIMMDAFKITRENKIYGNYVGSTPDTDAITEALDNKGCIMVNDNVEASYWFEPYCSNDQWSDGFKKFFKEQHKIDDDYMENECRKKLQEKNKKEE